MKLLITLFFTIVLSISIFGQAEPARSMPADFKSDGCTLFPDGNYHDCCVVHDEAYYFGGSAKERRAADKQLYKCVKSKKGWRNNVIAPVMWLGVRIGGVSFLPTPFRWGFGIKKPRAEPKIQDLKTSEKTIAQ